MEKVYYDPSHPAGYGGAKSLRSAAVASGSAVNQWLQGQSAFTLHKSVWKRGFPTRAYKVSGMDELWQADIMEMLPFAAKVNNGYRYVLTIIDVFSRYAWAVPLKSKSGSEVAAAFEKVLKRQLGDEHVVPRYIQTDEGKEFYNTKCAKVFADYGIKHYSVYSQFKAAVVERFNRTLRMRLSRYFTHIGHKVWYKVLPKMLVSYNNSKHRGIYNFRPVDITKETAMQLWEINQQQEKGKTKKKPKFKLLDYCRISRIKGYQSFVKNFDQNWSEEVFRINAIHPQTPIRYTIEDLHGHVIHGKFYEPELQKVAKPTVFRIEHILRTKGKGNYKQYFVKWVGYPKQYNSWIQAKDVIQPT